MINVYLHPNREEDYPRSGGVREHLIQLKKYMERSEIINLLPYRAVSIAHTQHVEATYSPVLYNVPLVYMCHGGFIPRVYPTVTRNLRAATIIISVAQWLADKYFPEYAHKTVVIPNGIDLSEFDNLPQSGMEPGYVLYAKEWLYEYDDFMNLANLLPMQRFVTTVWPSNFRQPPNVTVIGVQSREVIKSYIKNAGLLMLTGSEVCPTMLLEAWAAKTPVLAKNKDGNREVMQPFIPESNEVIGGMLYNTIGEAVAYTQYIMDDREALGNDGHQRVVDRYRWEDLIERYEAVYQSMLEPV